MSGFGMFGGGIPSSLRKLIGISSSASEIDDSINKRENLTVGTDIVDYTNNISLLDSTKWIKFIMGGNTASLSNSSMYTKFDTSSLLISQPTIGNAPLEGWKTTFSTPQDFSEVDYFTMWVYLPTQPVKNGESGSAFGSIMLIMGNTSFSIAIGAKPFGTDFSWRKGWNNITIPKSSFSIVISGTIDWANITGFQIRVEETNGGNGGEFYVDSFLAGGSKPKKIPICITMDDGYFESIEMA